MPAEEIASDSKKKHKIKTPVSHQKQVAEGKEEINCPENRTGEFRGKLSYHRSGGQVPGETITYIFI